MIMTTFAEKYKGNYNGSLEGFNIKITDKMLAREKELEARGLNKDRSDDLDDKERLELNLIEFIKSANISKAHLGDGIDDNNQYSNFLKEADIVYGIAKELGIDLKTYYQD